MSSRRSRVGVACLGVARAQGAAAAGNQDARVAGVAVAPADDGDVETRDRSGDEEPPGLGPAAAVEPRAKKINK